MRAATRTWATALGISAALAVAGCSGSDSGGQEKKKQADSGRELFLEPVAAQGPDPFTDSTARAAETPPPVTRSPQPSPSGSSSPADQGVRSLAGGTPGLYGGTQRTGSCDVGRQVQYLTAEPARARAFAGVVGITQDRVPAYLRGLTPVVLRADTRVTNHGYRDGRATAFQSVLQAGTAVLVDDRGLPRVRCACGNPLRPPVAFRQTPTHSGQQWQGYRPTKVVVVTPAPRPVTVIVIVNIVNNTWIERRTGDEHCRDDKPVPPPKPWPTDPTDPTDPSDSTDPGDATDPTDATDSTDPSDSGDPDDTRDPDEFQDPSDSTDSTDGTDPADPSDRSDTTDPSDGTDPGDPADPSDPTDPSGPSDRVPDPATPDQYGTSVDCPTPGTGDPFGGPQTPLPPGCPTPPAAARGR
ncbi:DUF6777 domain-containing protein [Streptomyces sp. LNU-CPARS28]|uniref:DUF6777 domain-containing protein n=1 Tax=Streptomyces sp. LNU-CPARS28 TaxID=3137371 RepID=UPI0031367D80